MANENVNIGAGLPSYQSPFGKDSLFNEEGYISYINFQKLIPEMHLWRDTKVLYDYRDFQSRRVAFPVRLGLLNSSYNEMELTEKQLAKGQNPIEQVLFGPYRRVDIPYFDESNHYTFLKGKLNIKVGHIKVNREHVGFSFHLNAAKREVNYQDYIFYTDPVTGGPANEWAITIGTSHFESYLLLCEAEGLYLQEGTVKRISDGFARELSHYANKPNGLDWLYYVMPDFLLYSRDKLLLLNDLATLLQDDVNESGNDFINEERIVLRIIEVFLVAKEEEKNNFLSRLSSSSVGEKTLFELLYDKMNDWGGEDNFTRAIQLLYTIWASSEYVEPGRYNYNGQPETLAYQGRKILGFYGSDLYDFDFKTSFIRVTEKEQIWPEFDSGEGPYSSIEKVKAVYDYSFFQPIRLPELDQVGELTIPDTLIPAFYLKAFDDKKAWANFEKSIWLAIDIATTMAGFGNVLKLRYLGHLSKMGKTIRLAIAGMEVASGVVGTMLNLINECTDKSFCDKLRSYLFWLDLATLSADALTQRMLRMSAREAADSMPDMVKRENPAVVDHLEGVRVSGRGRHYGQRLTKREVSKVSRYLARMNCEVRVYPANGVHSIGDFFTIEGTPVQLKENAGAVFVTDNARMLIGLREEATLYELFHEMMHFRHCKKIGLSKYRQLAKSNNPFGILEKEQYVFDKIVENKDLFTQDELEHALRYINTSIYPFAGKFPTNFTFPIDEVPLIRPKVSIDEILNRK